MCGISAVIALDKLSDHYVQTSRYRQDTLHQLQQSLDSIQHRGPDGQGAWISDDNRVALGHNRLAIRDLSSNGQQPLHSSSHDVHAIVNGEFYDYATLRASLEGEGYEFHSNSDSELLLALYTRHGLSFFEHLRGEFAFVLYDAARQTLVAARDRFGVKPLFWAICDGRLLIASEAKALRPFGWKAKWDVRSLVEDGWLHDERTLFKGVRKVLPGQYMVCQSFDFIKHRTYWEIEYPNKNIREMRTEDEMVIDLQHKLVDAVTARLQSDVPIGVYLSGGLDSAAVAGIAAAVLGKQTANSEGSQTQTGEPNGSPLICFNVGFDSNTEYDETPMAKRTADFLNLPFVSKQIDEADFANNFEKTYFHCEHHNPDLNSVAKFVLSGLAQQHGVKVILSGEGSDEHFGGYKLFIPDFLREPDATFGRNGISPHSRSLLVNRYARATTAIYQGAETACSLADASLACHQTNNSLIIKSMIPVTLAPFATWTDHAFGSGRPSVPEARANNSDARVMGKMQHKWHPLHTSQYIWTRSILPNLILTCMGDRMEMAHSIEGRPVFLDHHFTEFANSLPVSLKIKMGHKQSKPNGLGCRENGRKKSSRKRKDELVFKEKYILRQAVRPYITEEMYHRTKHPFTAPYMFPINGPMHRLLARLVTRGNVSQLGFVDVEAALALLRVAFAPFTPEQDFDSRHTEKATRNTGHQGFAMRSLFVVAQWVVLSKVLDIERAEPGHKGSCQTPAHGSVTEEAATCEYRNGFVSQLPNGTEWAWL